MTYTLRPRQAEAVAAGVEQLSSGRRKNGLIGLPTGYGKSLVIASTVLALDTPCTVLQPSKEILEQNEAKFISYGYRPSVFSASVRRREVGDITLATIGSIKDCPELFRGTSIIMDEAHGFNAKEGMYREFYDAIGRPPLLGFTATPYRLVSEPDGMILKFLTRTRPRVFDELIYFVQNRTGFDEGHLCPLTYKQWLAIDPSKLETNASGSDYSDESVDEHFEDVGFADKEERVVRRLLDMERKHILVFNRSIPQAMRLAEALPSCAVVTEKTAPRERERILAEFKAGRIQVVCNVGVLIVGFDFPELDAVVLANPTMSLTRYYQMCGRGMRPHPSKTDTLIVDMVGLVKLFGRIEDLELRDRGGWAIWSGSRQLTNIHFGEAKNRCKACRSFVSFGRHHVNNRPALLQKPAFGRKPNVIVFKNRVGKMVYRIVGKDEADEVKVKAKFIMHWSVCELARAYNQPEEIVQ